jgi:hypothetical protein
MEREIDWNAATIPINVPVNSEGNRFVATLKFPLALLMRPSDFAKLRSDMGLGELSLMGLAEKVSVVEEEAIRPAQEEPAAPDEELDEALD